VAQSVVWHLVQGWLGALLMVVQQLQLASSIMLLLYLATCGMHHAFLASSPRTSWQ
jgi:phosphotransferase system  glucose/maltose/N-acetylglucosamine-specific IIC component